MPFGTPTIGPELPTYTIGIHFASPPSDAPQAVVTVVSPAGASSETDMDTLTQMIVDLVDSSPDLVVDSATKTKLSNQEVTPTP